MTHERLGAPPPLPDAWSMRLLDDELGHVAGASARVAAFLSQERHVSMFL
jgi:hypothetical protein